MMQNVKAIMETTHTSNGMLKIANANVMMMHLKLIAQVTGRPFPLETSVNVNVTNVRSLMVCVEHGMVTNATGSPSLNLNPNARTNPVHQ